MSREVAPLDETALAEAEALLARACAFDRAAEVAGEKLFGGSPAGGDWAVGVREDGRLAGVAAGAGRWLRLLAVDPAARGRGAGTALLETALARARDLGASRLRTGDQPGNYLAPGVDVRDEETLGWLARRGFGCAGENENLVVPLAGNPLVTAGRAAALAAEAAAAGYRIDRAAAADRDALRELAARSFAPAWGYEIARALELSPPGVHVARDGAGAVVAFAVHDGNNRGLGWFGPAGTLPEHRGRGLGQALLLPCLLDVAAAGHPQCDVAWIGPRAFYERAAGAQQGRRFAVLERAT